MKTRLYLSVIVAALSTSMLKSVNAQGNFGNLNFESANIPPGTQPGSIVSASSAFPRWSANGVIGYDAFSAGGTVVSVVDSMVPGIAPLQGNYSVFLFGGTGNPATLSQTGLVPAGTHSITVDLSGSGIPLFGLSVGGQTVQMVPIATFANYTEYGGDVSAFANQQEQLILTEQPPAGVPPSVLELDNIIFSPNIIPEPATWTLMLCGVCLFGMSRWRREL